MKITMLTIQNHDFYVSVFSHFVKLLNIIHYVLLTQKLKTIRINIHVKV